MINVAEANRSLEGVFLWLSSVLLPIGWISLLTGMLWVGERTLYHKLFYVLIAAPAVFSLILRPGLLRSFFRSPLIMVFMLFAVYMMVTLLWSETDRVFFSLVKRPIYVLVLFFSVGIVALEAPGQIWRIFMVSAAIGAVVALVTCLMLFRDGVPGRFYGYGVLKNPLLSSHVYGFFFVLWASIWFLQKRYFNPAALLSTGVFGLLIIATGSRTPLLAIAVSLLWLMLVDWSKRSLIVGAVGVLGGGVMFLLSPISLLSRGLSFRPEIWGKTWQEVLEAPWLGHGYEAPIELWITAHDVALTDPHNLSLSVLYEGGAIGLVLWGALYAIALRLAWKYRKQQLTMVASALLVFGFTAGMTEGGAFLSRPKEHWFLVWIPMALLYATVLIKTVQANASTSDCCGPILAEDAAP